ncbi:RNA polymerase II mediator complex subunit [Conoideocrella luteorostrata]|uniref:Mediator of RNA polymerase II transcription subunit 10 n=1 Tax=Conoideocrella luteorostrata TaxID=1105319 RepID=A0AAJ0CUP4_9HYPO|nr:RNA polymerase II mediator complex subunit [Conoideocrella luteorostrata]
MAPVDRTDHDGLEQQLKDIIQDLYQVMVQVSTYDTTGRSSREVLSNEMFVIHPSPPSRTQNASRATSFHPKTLSQSLQSLHATTSSPHATLPSVPPELLEYVENGRNPDIYTREFVELVRRGNQLMRGKCHAFGDFRDVLAQEMASAMPELRADVEKILSETGGKSLMNGSGTGSADSTSAS